MSINVSIPFTSPWLSFLPYSDGDAAGGWKAAGNGFGANSPLGDTQDAFRWTQAQGSKLNLNFNGTAAYVYGSTQGGATYTSAVGDSSSSSPSGSLLGSFESLDYATPHALSLEVTAARADAWLSVSEVIITIPKNGQANSTYDDANTNAFMYGGTWGVGAAASQGTYLQTTTYTQQKGATATVNFTGSAVYLFGSIQPDHGLYSVTIDDVDQGTFNGSSRSGFVQQLLFFGSGYAKDELHVLVVTDADGSKLDVDYVTFLGKTSDARTRRIAGISVGAAVAAGIAGSIVFWIWRTERNGRRKMEDYVRMFVEKSQTTY